MLGAYEGTGEQVGGGAVRNFDCTPAEDTYPGEGLSQLSVPN